MDFYHLEDFLEQTNHSNNKMIDKKIKNFIKQQSLKDFPNETCGFIVKKNNQFSCIPCENIAENPKEYFKISSFKFLEIKKNYKIYYIYHSHIENDIFSEMDKNCSDNLNIPLILYFLKKDTINIYEPINVKQEYIGRFYKYKKYDCFTLVRDFYLKELNYDLTVEYKESLEDINVKDYFLKYHTIKNLTCINNFNECNLKINDIILMDGIKKSSHCAVYLGNDKILHQPRFGFSKIENYCNFYKNHTDSIFRLKI